MSQGNQGHRRPKVKIYVQCMPGRGYCDYKNDIDLIEKCTENEAKAYVNYPKK